MCLVIAHLVLPTHCQGKSECLVLQYSPIRFFCTPVYYTKIKNYTMCDFLYSH